ncbi:MAG: ATP-dependent helicase C-terminal domain-containing protein, partial [Halieaceae bacterium]|nr:ATP-dependent helicase C-terminal domain-containing protein [Halieaceae bacterium]
LWSENQQQQLAAQAEPEIAQADLAPLALELLAWGISDPDEMRWLTPPPAGAWRQALGLLEQLGALEPEVRPPRLSARGQRMAQFPAHPRLAHLLLMGQAAGAPDTACLLAAALSDRDPLGRESADIALRLEYLQGERSPSSALRGWVKRSEQLAAQFRRQLASPGNVHRLPSLQREQLPGFLLACAYPDRIARRRSSGAYQLANGRSAEFEAPQPLAKHKWLVIAEAGGLAGKSRDRIRCAAALDPRLFEDQLAELLREHTRLEWESSSGRFVATRERRIGALLLSSTAIDKVDDELRVRGLVELLREGALRQLPWNDDARRLQLRLEHIGRLDQAWPDGSMAALAESLEDWLAPFLAPVRRLADLKKLDLGAALRARLSWEQQQQLDQWLPERIEVPSGSSIRVDYGADPPVLAVKLQEMFGCEASPRLAQGRLPVVIHLLSPAGRPLQVTQDLASFWRDGYTAVKKEMKGRYPKHPWPDDPVGAIATRHTKVRR